MLFLVQHLLVHGKDLALAEVGALWVLLVIIFFTQTFFLYD